MRVKCVDVAIRPVSPDDAEALARMRVGLARDHPDDGRIADALAAGYYERCAAFFRYALRGAGDTFAWLAEHDGAVVGSAVLILHLSPPRSDSSDSTRGVPLDARLRSVYVEEPFRRRGIARRLVSAAIDRAREYGCYRVSLGASSMAVPLYASLGFVPAEREMKLKL